MNEEYFIQKNVDKLYNGECSNFLDYRQISKIKGKIKFKYNMYKPFIESERVILYTNKLPNISLYEIKSYDKLKHQDIMGTIYNLGLDESLFGDIVIENDRYFIYVFSKIELSFIDSFRYVKNSKITLEKHDIDYLKDYKKKYEELTLIVSSKRIDTIVSRITNINRKDLIDKFKNNEIIINNLPVKNNSYILKENDIFSIRKYGKYKYIGVDNYTKKDNLVIKINKYI